MINRFLLLITSFVVFTGVACSVFNTTPEPTIELTPTSRPTPTRLPSAPVQPGEANPNEPVVVSGLIPFTSPFFINSIAEPFVLLEDQAGFVARDKEFEFSLAGQAIGPVDFGVIRVRHQGKEEVFTVAGGVMDVQPTIVTILADVAENVMEIDIARAEAARKRAENYLEEGPPRDTDAYLRMEAALRRSKLRLDAVRRYRRRPRSQISPMLEDEASG